MVFFIGFRYKIASDWLVYMDFYSMMGNIFQPFPEILKLVEPGFKFLMAVFKTLGLNFEIMVFCISLFNIYSLLSFIKRTQISYPITFLSIFLILYVFRDFDILRQSVAFYIMLFAFDKNGIKTKKFIILNIAALMFHYTVIIFIPFFFFQKIKITKSRLGIVTIVYLISLFYTLPVISFIIDFFLLFIPASLEAFIYKARGLAIAYGFSRNISFTTLLNFIFIFLLWFNFNKLKHLKKSEIILIKVFVFYILLQSLFKEVQEVVDRLSYYFVFGLAFMFVALNYLISLKEKRYFMIIIPCLFIILKLYLHFNNPAIWYGQTPYRNYLLKSMINEENISYRYYMMQKIGKEQDESKRN